MSQTQLRFFLPDNSCHLCAAMAGCRAHPRLYLWRMILPEHLQKDMLRSSSRDTEQRVLFVLESVPGQELKEVPSKVCSEAAYLWEHSSESESQ